MHFFTKLNLIHFITLLIANFPIKQTGILVKFNFLLIKLNTKLNNDSIYKVSWLLCAK